MSLRKRFKKIEWSKKFCGLVAFGFGIYGVWCGIEYYNLVRIAMEYGTVVPDVTLAVVSVTTVIASLISYLLYQAGLKNSRNKYGVDADGQPYRVKQEDYEESAEDHKDTDVVG